MRLGVDFSQWGGVLTADTVRCWKTKGVSFAIVQYSERMPQHLETLRLAGGIDIEAYVYLYWGRSQTPADRTRAALAMAQPIKRLWLDAEDSSNPFSEAELLAAVDVCNQAGVPCGIYTGRWWWTSHGRNSTAFSHLPLWDARYLGEAPTPNLDLQPKDLVTGFRPYGGWLEPTIHQWWNTTLLCGHSVDLNVAADETTEEEPMPNPVWAEWKDRPATIPYRSYLLFTTLAGLKKRHVASSEEHDALAASDVAGKGLPKRLPLDVLKTFEGGPEPDEA